VITFETTNSRNLFWLELQGRTVIKDQGYFTVGTRLLLKVLDLNLFADIAAAGIGLAGDYWKLKKDRSAEKKKR